MTKLTSWLNRYIIAALVIAALGGMVATISIVVAIFTYHSGKSADHLSQRAEMLLMEAVATRDIRELQRIGAIVLANPMTHSFHVYQRRDDGALTPFFARRSLAQPPTADSLKRLLSKPLSPLFSHERSMPVIWEGGEIGMINLDIRDYDRQYASVTLSITILVFFLLTVAALIGIGAWRGREHNMALGLLYRELASPIDRQHHQKSDRLRHHPLLSRIHGRILHQKTTIKTLSSHLTDSQKELLACQRLLSKIHHDNTSLKRGTPTNSPMESDFEYLATLAEDLAKRLTDPQKKATAELIFHTLSGAMKSGDLTVSPHGETDTMQVSCILHQISCHHHDPDVIFTPKCDLDQAYQGDASSITKVAFWLLNATSEHNHSDSPLHLSLCQDPTSQQLMLCCLLTSPISRSESDATLFLSERKSIRAFKTKVERSGGIFKLKQNNAGEVMVEVTLPLLPTRKSRAFKALTPEPSGKPLYFLTNSARAESLFEFYQRSGCEILSLAASQVTMAEPGTMIILNEHSTCQSEVAKKASSNNHDIVIITDPDTYSACEIENPLSVIDLRASPLYHMEQIAALHQDKLPTDISRGPLASLKTQSPLGNIITRLRQKSPQDNPVVLWVPITLPEIVEAPIQASLPGHGIQLRHYDPGELTRPLAAKSGDSILMTASQMRHGAPKSPLGESPRLIMLLEDELSIPDLSSLPDVHKVISLPIDTGYLSSIVLEPSSVA